MGAEIRLDREKCIVLKSDNGGENSFYEFVQCYIERGISDEFTCLYTPEQNGVTERLNHTIIETARSMINHANFHLNFGQKQSIQQFMYLIESNQCTER